MGKAERNRQSARERIAAQQRQARQAEVRRRAWFIGGITLVVLAVIAIVIVSELSKKTTNSGTPGGTALPAGVQAKVASVPVSTLAAVGTGSAIPSAIRTVSGPRLTSGGKPQMLYIGAEWCPYCAAERWAMAVALSRFGSFSPLHGLHSSSTDVYPNTATLTFYRSTYTSKYLVFTPIENEDINHNLLVSPTPGEKALWSKYEPGEGYPFIDIGNRYVSSATYDPQVLSGKTWSQIASALHDPSSAVAQGAVGSANLFTAAICKITGDMPTNVCTTAPVTTVSGKI